MQIKSFTAEKPNNEVRNGITWTDSDAGRTYQERTQSGVIAYTPDKYFTLPVTEYNGNNLTVAIGQDNEFPIYLTISVSDKNKFAQFVDCIFDTEYSSGISKIKRFKILGFRYCEDIVDDEEY